MSKGFLGGGFDVAGLGMAVAIGDVVVNRVVKQNRILRNESDLLAQAAQVQRANIQAIDENPAGVYEQLRQRPDVPQRELEEFGRLLNVR